MVKKLRLFISYGRQPEKYVNTVLRIKSDLEQAGHHVWIDREGLSSGDDWEQNLEEAISNQEMVIFFITEHAARRPDGFCLNELSYAVNQKKPIAPVMMENITPPLSICRLQWLDMMDIWSAEGDLDEEKYKNTLQELLDVLSGDKQLGFNGGQRSLANLLEPENFDHDISKHTKDFIGRQWVYDLIIDWLQKKSSSRVLWLTGQAGFGKSAIAGNAAHKLPHVAGIFFCQYDSVTRRDPLVMLISFTYHLATQLTSYYELIDKISYDDLRKHRNCPRDFFQRFLIEPLLTIEEPENNYVFIIDGLDEIVDQKWGIIHLINNEFEKLPDWLKVIITSRPEPELKRKLSRISLTSLETETIKNQSDIKEMLLKQIPNLNESQADIILQKSEGNMLYATEVISEIQKGKLSVDELDQFPEGLTGVYRKYFERQFPDTAIYKNYQRKVFELISAAIEPISISLIAEVLSWDEYEINDAIEPIGSLIISHDSRISYFHKSIKEWLENRERCNKNYFVSAKKGHEVLAKSYLEGNKNSYLDKWGFSHLLNIEMIHEGITLLTSNPSDYLTSAVQNLFHNIQYPEEEKKVYNFLEALYKSDRKLTLYTIIQIATSMLQSGYFEEAVKLAMNVLNKEDLSQLIIFLNLKDAELKSDYNEMEKHLSTLFSYQGLDEQLYGIGCYFSADKKRVTNEQSAYNDFAKAVELINSDYLFDYSMEASCWQADQLYVMGDVNSSEELLNKLLDKADRHNSRKMTGTIYRLIGQIYYTKQEYEKALEFFNYSLIDLKESRQYVKQTLTLNNIGQAHIYVEPVKAEDFILQSRKLAEEIKYPREEGKTYYTEAELHIALGNYRRALELLEIAKEKLNDIGYIDGVHYCNCLFARASLLLKDYSSAYKQALNTYQAYNKKQKYPTRQVYLLQIIKESTTKLNSPGKFKEILPSLDNIKYLDQYSFIEEFVAELSK